MALNLNPQKRFHNDAKVTSLCSRIREDWILYLTSKKYLSKTPTHPTITLTLFCKYRPLILHRTKKEYFCCPWQNERRKHLKIPETRYHGHHFNESPFRDSLHNFLVFCFVSLFFGLIVVAMKGGIERNVKSSENIAANKWS